MAGSAMTAPRPICVNCKASYGARETRIENLIWPEGEPMPEYRGNGVVTKRVVWKTAPHESSGSFMGKPFGPNDNVATMSIWDGETWSTPYAPFCALRCALDYARRAYRKQLREER